MVLNEIRVEWVYSYDEIKRLIGEPLVNNDDGLVVIRAEELRRGGTLEVILHSNGGYYDATPRIRVSLNGADKSFWLCYDFDYGSKEDIERTIYKYIIYYWAKRVQRQY